MVERGVMEQLPASGQVEVIGEPRVLDVSPGPVRVETWYSSMSSRTGLTGYRASKPYVTKAWDAHRRLHLDTPPDVTAPSLGALAHRKRGHRAEAVLPAAAVASRLAAQRDDPPHAAVFARPRRPPSTSSYRRTCVSVSGQPSSPCSIDSRKRRFKSCCVLPAPRPRRRGLPTDFAEAFDDSKL